MGLRKVNRDKLIEVASHFFRTQGYHGTSMDRIALHLKINKASLYHHITGKEALALKALETQFHFFNDHLFSCAFQENRPVRERLCHLATALETYFLNTHGGSLMANFTLELGAEAYPSFTSVIRAYFNRWENTLTHLLSAVYPVEEAQSLALQAMMRFQGALILLRLGQSECLIKQKDYLLKTFDQGMISATFSEEHLTSSPTPSALQHPTRVESSVSA